MDSRLVVSELFVDSRQDEDSYPLGPAQQGMLVQSLLEPNLGWYVNHWVCDLRHPVDVPAFWRAWQRLAERHAIFRTSFHWKGSGEPQQIVHRQVMLPVVEADLRSLSPDEQTTFITRQVRAEHRRSFDLEGAPLLRLFLYRIADEHYCLHRVAHHILSDGWATTLVMRELFEHYDAYRQGGELSLPQPLPYRRYIDWQRQQDLVAAEQFWRRELRGFASPTPFQIDGLPARAIDPAEPQEFPRLVWGVQRRMLSLGFTAELSALAKEHHITINTLLLSAWAILLNRYSGESDVVFGATRSGRKAALEGADELIGVLVNSLPLRARFTPNQTLSELWHELRRQWLDIAPYEHTSLATIQAWSELAPGALLFESLVNFYPQTMDESLRAMGGDWLQRSFRLHQQPGYPLVLDAYGGQQLQLNLFYDDRRFGHGAIQRLMGHLETMLQGMVEKPAVRVRDLPMLTTTERQRLMALGAPSAAYDTQSCLHQVFEAQANSSPEAVALTYVPSGGGTVQQYTYAGLNARANQLAHHLLNLGVLPGDRVGLCLERSPELVVGVLGILKTGAAYIPLDPQSPAERLNYMMRDAHATALVTSAALEQQFPEAGCRIVRLDADQPVLQRASSQNPPSQARPQDSAYVIYTSGSTGAPKGVVVSHANVLRLFQATQSWFSFNAQDVWTLFHSIAFDFSVWELWGALLYGGRLVVVSYWTSRDPHAFARLIDEQGVTILNQTPSAFMQLLQAPLMLDGRHAQRLRLVIFGGEALNIPSLRPWFERRGDIHPRLVNMYGITETTVHVTYRPLTTADPEHRASLIGVPIPDLSLRLLDENLQPVPVGVPGEICVGGAGVSQGYLDRPGLTAERFIPDPFSALPGARLYRSGDLGRYLPGGDLEYLGRMDLQVKLRGFRIELGEIEAVLASHPAVRQAVVELRSSGDSSRLVTYLVAPDALEQDLRQHLKSCLPDYMLPASFVFLDKLPLTANGKIDRQALPDPQEVALQSPGMQPRTPLERVLAGIWAGVLGLPVVGVQESFFELGGNSLSAIRLVTQVSELLGVQSSLRMIFDAPTVAQFGAELSLLTSPQNLEMAARLALKVAAMSDEDVHKMLGGLR